MKSCRFIELAHEGNAYVISKSAVPHLQCVRRERMDAAEQALSDSGNGGNRFCWGFRADQVIDGHDENARVRAPQWRRIGFARLEQRRSWQGVSTGDARGRLADRKVCTWVPTRLPAWCARICCPTRSPIAEMCGTFVLHLIPIQHPQDTTMSTTTIRLPDELKARVAAAAERAGSTPHGFMLEAIAEKAAEAERRADFDAEAEERYAAIVASGKTIPWDQMRRYLEQRISGTPAKRPLPKKLAR